MNDEQEKINATTAALRGAEWDRMHPEWTPHVGAGLEYEDTVEAIRLTPTVPAEDFLRAHIMDGLILAVDFDGTLCEHRWPEIGPPRWGVLPAVRSAQRAGARVILWTNRAGERLAEAVAWCAEHGLHFDAVNENLPETIARHGGDSRKITADYFIDDRVLSADALQSRWESEQAAHGPATVKEERP